MHWRWRKKISTLVVSTVLLSLIPFGGVNASSPLLSLDSPYKSVTPSIFQTLNHSTSPSVGGHSYFYDNSGRLSYSLLPSGDFLNYQYDFNGNILRKIKTSYRAFASSNIAGWEAYKVTDNNPSTVWSSVPRSGELNSEWIALDLGSTKFIGRVSLTPRGTLSFPKDFKLQSSNDAVTWTDIPGQSYSGYTNDGSVHAFSFGSSVVARYVRVYATRLGMDDTGNYYFQLTDFNASISNVAASSNIAGWEAYKVTDNNPSTVWSSVPRSGELSSEWTALDLGSTKFIGRVSLTPRGTLSFPKDFKLQSSNDAVTWTDIPGQSYSGYTNDGSVHAFSFGSSVVARYVRVYATRLGMDDTGNYYFQLTDFNASISNVAASSNIAGWEAYKVTDNNPSTVWSSVPRSGELSSEWTALDLGSTKFIGRVSLTPRGTLSFPKDFKLQSSNDAVTWTDIPGQSYSGYTNDGSVHAFSFGSSVVARYVRVYATRLGMDDTGGYYFQLVEFQASSK